MPGRLSGTTPGIHLNAAGRDQAAAVASVLASTPLAAVVSSPLERARETADAIAGSHCLDVEIIAALGEFEFGDWTGRTMPELMGDERWTRFNKARSLTSTPSGESMLDVQRRAVAAILALRERFPERIVAAVSHGDVIRSVLLHVLGMPIDFVHRLEVSPARINIIQLFDDFARVLQVNGDSVSTLT